MIDLQKGERFNLSKEGSSLTKLRLGLGWSPIQKSKEEKTTKKKGFFASLFSKKEEPASYNTSIFAPNIDIDASVYMLDKNDKMINGESLIFYGNLKSKCGSVRHSGDNLTGSGSGDDETIFVDLNQVPEKIEKLLFVVNIYSCMARSQHFGMISDAYINLYDDRSNTIVAKYSLSDDYDKLTAINVAEVYRKNGEWRFKALGEGYYAPGLSEISAKFR